MHYRSPNGPTNFPEEPKNIRQNLVSLNDFIYESRSLGALSQYGGESIAAEEEGK